MGRQRAVEHRAADGMKHRAPGRAEPRVDQPGPQPGDTAAGHSQQGGTADAEFQKGASLHAGSGKLARRQCCTLAAGDVRDS